MENGFELDDVSSPGFDCEFGNMCIDHGVIGEPDAASLDFFESEDGASSYSPGLTVTVENAERPDGDRNKALSFARPTTNGSNNTVIHLTRFELITTFYALAEYLGKELT